MLLRGDDDLHLFDAGLADTGWRALAGSATCAASAPSRGPAEGGEGLQRRQLVMLHPHSSSG